MFSRDWKWEKGSCGGETTNSKDYNMLIQYGHVHLGKVASMNMMTIPYDHNMFIPCGLALLSYIHDNMGFYLMTHLFMYALMFILF